MAIPEPDLLRIGRWCQTRVSPKHLDQMRIECEIADRHITISGARPPRGGHGAEWMQFPVTRFHYAQKTAQWQMYRRDQNFRFRCYMRKRPTGNVWALLDCIESGEDPIF